MMRFTYSIRSNVWYYENTFSKFVRRDNNNRCLALVLTDGKNYYRIEKPTRAVGFHMFRENDCIVYHAEYCYNQLEEIMYIHTEEKAYALLITELLLSDEASYCREEKEKLITFY